MDVVACPAGSRAAEANNTNAGAADVVSARSQAAYEGPEWLSVPKAAKFAGVGRRTVYLWVKRKIVDVAYLPSGTMRIRVGSLLRTETRPPIERWVKRKGMGAAKRHGPDGKFAGIDATKPDPVAIAPALPAAEPVDLRSAENAVAAELTGPELQRAYEDATAPGRQLTDIVGAVAGQPIHIPAPKRVPIGRRPTT
jgi:hypothetical protein